MSTDYASMTPEELLRADIRETREAAAQYGWDDQVLAFALGQTYAGIVRGHPNLEKVWSKETAPTQAQLDLHLTEGSVEGHSAPADTLAHLITGISEATTQIAKERLGRKRYSSPVLARGIGQGSVRVVLEIQSHEDDESPGSMGEVSTVDSAALRTVAAILVSADDMSENSPLTAQIRPLNAKARRGLIRAAKQIASQQWRVEGRIAQRGFEPSDVKLTPGGARRLAVELKNEPMVPKPVTVFGQVMGTLDIEGIVYFKPEGGQQLRTVTLNQDVARDALALQPDHPLVKAEFLVYQAFSAGGDVIKRSWEMQAVELTEQPGQQSELL